TNIQTGPLDGGTPRYILSHIHKRAKTWAAEGRSGGHLILLSLIGGQIVMPAASGYQTSKYAINRLSEFE
ncbi:MAG: hypothetical protein WAO67_13115, partial [Yoonia sp.]